MTTQVPDLIRFGREVCGDLAQAERREWWLANGQGAYAAGTIAGSLTRRYHGLLVAPVNPPLGRFLVLSKADATLIDGDRRYPLFTNRWGDGVVEPAGHAHIESFRLDGRMPVWHYAIGDIALEQRVWMEHGANTVHVAWRLLPGMVRPRPLKLRVTLLANARDHHVSARPWEFHPVIEAEGPELKVRHPNWFTLHVKVRGGTLAPRHEWHENFQLAAERERGLPEQDNHLCVGQAEFVLQEGEWSGLVAGLDPSASPYLAESLRRALARDAGELKRSRVQIPELFEAPAWVDQLVLAADNFVFARPIASVPDGESVIAGYPWFGDWGRDTMIALPGLTLATGRYETALRILRTFARFVDQGMLPNVFPGAGEKPEYNTADAALWFVDACRAYVQALGDRAALKELFPVLEDIVAWHVKGTRYGIRMDERDALLFAGEPGVQVTWMDAKIGDWVVTPRAGKPVEINALWYNALAAMAEFADELGRPSATYRDLAARARAGFQRFIRPGDEGLNDVLDGPGGDDATLRPNQILAVSLPHSPLDPEAQRRVVARVGRDLLTSYGLRSLAPGHPEFRARYLGGVWERDSSYHQGPVWAWLLGHYALAEARVTGDPAAAQARLAPLRDHLLDAGLGTVSEIFDGAAPHTPRGAPSQAWSVACTLEAWWRLEKAKRQQREAMDSVGRVSAA
ncbi:MAG TPA: amylo-alpha-1,6-glucosidase [Burkholderiales bacterium]|nr:amylo-alpha-1,6-glucosidase [Burkholderiales bacterium]